MHTDQIKAGRVQHDLGHTPTTAALGRHFESYQRCNLAFDFHIGLRNLPMVDYRDVWWTATVRDGEWLEIKFADNIIEYDREQNVYSFEVHQGRDLPTAVYYSLPSVMARVRTGCDMNEFMMVLDMNKCLGLEERLTFNEEMAEMITAMNLNRGQNSGYY